MLNHRERQKLVKPSPNSDHEMTANDTDDEHIYVDVHNRKPRRIPFKLRTYLMGFIFLSVLITFIIGYLVYQNYTNEHNSINSAATNSNALQQADTGKVAVTVDPFDFEYTSKTPIPKLPGIYLMNKGYNLLMGKELYEQTGVDLISYTFQNSNGKSIYTSSTPAYMIPNEFRMTPNIEPSCSIVTKVNDVYYSTSTNILNEQSKSASVGFQAKVNLEGKIKGSVGEASTSVTAKTQMKFGLMFGHTSSSKTAISKASQDFSHSFSVNTRNKFYKAEIDWDTNGENFQWKLELIDAVNNLKANATNQAILLFINDWGSHVLTKMQTGSFCKQTAYMSSKATQSEIDSFHQQVASHSSDFIFFTDTHTETKESASEKTSDSSQLHEFADIHCVGEVEIDSSDCAGHVSSVNNPIVTSYESLPIWRISYINQLLGIDVITKIETFFESLYESLHECSEKNCNSHGICTLDESIWSRSFINGWNDDFSQLWNIDDNNDYCFCEGPPQGKTCSSCDCFGDVGCCCRLDVTSNEYTYQCDGNNICSSTGLVCVAPSGQITGAQGGQPINCQDNTGVIFGACGSGANADCTANSGYQCGENAWNCIFCGYADLGAITGTGTWHCLGENDWGQLSCQTVGKHQLLTGICGTGTDASQCEDESTVATGVCIQCSNMDAINVDWNDCEWIPNADSGTFAICGSGYIGTGFCGSGEDAQCPDGADAYNAIQCCRIKYDDGTFKVNIDNNTMAVSCDGSTECHAKWYTTGNIYGGPNAMFRSGDPNTISYGKIPISAFASPIENTDEYKIKMISLQYQYSTDPGGNSPEPNFVLYLKDTKCNTKHTVYTSPGFTAHGWCNAADTTCYSGISTSQLGPLDVTVNSDWEFEFVFNNRESNIQILQSSWNIVVYWKPAN